MTGKHGPTPRSAADWERIEMNFRAGVLSVREIAKLDGNVTEGAIRKRAKTAKPPWERDLSAKVQARSDAQVRDIEVRIPTVKRTGRVPTEEEAIEIGAQALTDVKLSHRSSIRRMREHTLRLLDEMEQITGNAELFRTIGEMLRKENARGIDRANDAYQAVISLAGRIDGTKKLAETLKTLVTLEREAFGLSTGAGEGGAPPDAPAPSITDPQAYYAWLTKQGVRA